jgi:hypothetical protein
MGIMPCVSRPVPTPLCHFTHVDHIPMIIEHGLLSDSKAQTAGMLLTEVGHRGIKARRRTRPVPVGPGGAIGDYAPFYFAPRSPMMYVIHRGGVPTYDGGTDHLVYLVTTVERLAELGLFLVFTDRNAALKVAGFTEAMAQLDHFLDWALMGDERWSNTPEEPDRKERRMAECLAYERVPWEAFTTVAVKTEECAERASKIIAGLGKCTPVDVRPDWYF